MVILLKAMVLARLRSATTRRARAAAAVLLWVVAAGSKLVVLELVALVFGDAVSLGGLVPVIVPVLALLLSRPSCAGCCAGSVVSRGWSVAAATVTAMIVSMSTITVDCAHAGNLARFWAAVLGWDVAPDAGAEFAAVGGPHRPREAPSLMFLQVPEPKAGKNRVHLDLETQDLEGEVERLTALGASVVHRISEHGVTWVTFADPEGNEFCVAPPHALT